jgi:hypothetical protein
MPGATEVQYLVLPDATNPYLLARVRWPDVFQAISAARPDWQDDVGLFDLPYDPSSTRVTLDQAAALAVSWGARLPPDEPDEQAQMPEWALIRRMPASWSNLSPADKRAWSLDSAKTGRRATAEKNSTNNGGVGTTVSWLARLRRSDAVSPPPERSERVNEGVTSDLGAAPNDAPDREEGGNPALASIRVTAFESGDGVRKERVRPPAPTAKLVITTRKGRPPGVDR